MGRPLPDAGERVRAAPAVRPGCRSEVALGRRDQHVQRCLDQRRLDRFVERPALKEQRAGGLRGHRQVDRRGELTAVGRALPSAGDRLAPGVGEPGAQRLAKAGCRTDADSTARAAAPPAPSKKAANSRSSAHRSPRSDPVSGAAEPLPRAAMTSAIRSTRVGHRRYTVALPAPAAAATASTVTASYPTSANSCSVAARMTSPRAGSRGRPERGGRFEAPPLTSPVAVTPNHGRSQNCAEPPRTAGDRARRRRYPFRGNGTRGDQPTDRRPSPSAMPRPISGAATAAPATHPQTPSTTQNTTPTVDTRQPSRSRPQPRRAPRRHLSCRRGTRSARCRRDVPTHSPQSSTTPRARRASPQRPTPRSAG